MTPLFNRSTRMSPNLYPLFSVSESDNPEQLSDRIKMLIRLYLNDPNQIIADAVVKHITGILAHPGYIQDIEQRCQLRQLEMHWRCLTWLDITSKKGKPFEETPLPQLKMVMRK